MSTWPHQLFASLFRAQSVFGKPRRLVYNTLLSVIVLFYFFRAYPAAKAILTLDWILALFLLIVLANVA